MPRPQREQLLFDDPTQKRSDLHSFVAYDDVSGSNNITGINDTNLYVLEFLAKTIRVLHFLRCSAKYSIAWTVYIPYWHSSGKNTVVLGVILASLSC